MRLSAWLCCLFLVLPSADRAADAHTARQRMLFFNHDDRDRVHDASQWPWQAIGQLETASGNLCTATLISPRLALTAGHCVLAPPDGRADPPVALRFPAAAGWRYERRDLVALVNQTLRQRLKADGAGWVVPPEAATLDYALIRLATPPPGIRPLPMWSESRQALIQALTLRRQRVTQAGYPEDHQNTLYRHQDCRMTGWMHAAILTHRCDTLPGDSGSPLLLQSNGGWSLIGVQSSAPDARQRFRADNQALAVTAIRQQLQTLARQALRPADEK